MQITVSVEGAVSAAIEHWDSLSAAQIGAMAKTVWYQSNDNTNQTDLLCALELAKSLDPSMSWEALVALWEQILIGSCMGDRRKYERVVTVSCGGGLATAEGSRNYSKAKNLIERLFMPVILQRFEEKFGGTIAKIGGLEEASERIEAYDTLTIDLSGLVDEFDDFSKASTSKLQKWLKKKEESLEKLIEAEECAQESGDTTLEMPVVPIWAAKRKSNNVSRVEGT
ncbi:MAG TPA: hypothetical protein VGQ99_07230, partial [Tepidisphaeraceae bacterium]|nr:hypothetical protein [Tepidisphaeraceae bacterium]